jgi:prepilin-type N-terminal cleavage/methylation domain-containing protein
MAQRHGKQGFTLIEAAVAIAVVAILSGIIVPLVVKNLRDSQRARGLNDIQVLAAAVASQIKDTGTRPWQGIGAGTVAWGSGTTPTTLAPTNATVAAANSFVALFAGASTNALQNIFGFPAGTTVNAEFAYKGPYLATDVAQKTDPWGRSYLILGYNQTGRTNNTPIYIVSAGPNGSIAPNNWNTGMGPANGTWNLAAAGGLSADDLMVRVN